MKSLVLTLVLGLALTGCAAKGAKAKFGVATLSAGDAALELVDIERQASTANLPGYGPAEQAKVRVELVKVLRAVRGFERAVAAWPDSSSAVPTQVTEAQAAVSLALADFQKVIPQASQIKDPMDRIVRIILAAIAKPVAAMRIKLGDLDGLAQVPPFPITQVFAYIGLLMKLWETGRIKNLGKLLRDLLTKEGATPEELADLDVRLTTAIDELDKSDK